MKKIFILLSLIAITAYAQDEDKMVYGADGRKDVYESSYEGLAKTTAAMISKDNVKKVSEDYIVKGPNLMSELAVCESERFSNQPVIADCSGFLVAPDLLVTAGHCVQEEKGSVNFIV